VAISAAAEADSQAEQRLSLGSRHEGDQQHCRAGKQTSPEHYLDDADCNDRAEREEQQPCDDP